MSRKAVHWLKTMLLEPEIRSISSSRNKTATLVDSTQFLSTSTWNRLSVGAVISSCLLMTFLQNKCKVKSETCKIVNVLIYEGKNNMK